ncbi:MAG: hypothetical protein IPJ27_06515 [Candidatus Accumulibacter sp.]|uniref:Asparagine synthetase domain-containing protein n=1 Tax=Candidatus Accumulibacter proximus TaxID=2954385 RepID=A0A935UGG8_9PROT|nr:hypothetical protein [Candidatus Accumulibacter proximus]
MTQLAGALGFSDDWPTEIVAKEVASSTANGAFLGSTLIYTDRHLTLYSVNRYGDSEPPPVCIDGVTERSWVFGDISCSDWGLLGNQNGAINFDELSQRRMPGRWAVLGYDSGTGALRIAVDRLGVMWLYVGRVRGGYVFSSDFGAAAKAIAPGLTLDRDAVLSELIVGYSPNNATVFNEITMAPPGSTLYLESGGARTKRHSPIEYGDRFAGLSREKKFSRLDEVNDKIASTMLRQAGKDLALSLSAGFDSRFILGILNGGGISPHLYTFGHPDSDEVVNAREVAKCIQLSTALVDIPDPQWRIWERMIKQFGNTGMAQWVGWGDLWAEYLGSRENHIVIGFLGDILTGKSLGSNAQSCDDWEGQYFDFLTDGGWLSSPLLRPQARRRVISEVREQLQFGLQDAEFAFPHQKAMHLNLYGRQRRHTGAQPNVLCRSVLPILPFYIDEVIDFWCNLGLQDLMKQELYLSYAESRFSRLFPRRPSQARALFERAWRKASRLTQAALISKRETPQRPIVIDRNRAILPHKRQIIELARRVAPIADDIIDIDGFCQKVSNYAGERGGDAHGQIISAVNLFLLIELSL